MRQAAAAAVFAIVLAVGAFHPVVQAASDPTAPAGWYGSMAISFDDSNTFGNTVTTGGHSFGLDLYGAYLPAVADASSSIQQTEDKDNPGAWTCTRVTTITYSNPRLDADFHVLQGSAELTVADAGNYLATVQIDFDVTSTSVQTGAAEPGYEEGFAQACPQGTTQDTTASHATWAACGSAPSGWTLLTETDFNPDYCSPSDPNETLSWSLRIATEADLSVSNTASVPIGNAGTFTLIIKDLGPAAAANVSLSNPLSGTNWTITNLVTSQGTCTSNGTGFSCALGTVTPGADVGISVSVQSGAGILTSVASVSSSTPDPDTSNNTAPASIAFRAVLIVSGAYDYAGSVTVSAASIVGSDRGQASGDPGALARVGSVCVNSWWTVTVKLTVPTSAPIYWNGVPFPFADSGFEGWTPVSRTAPKKNGLYDGTYSETMYVRTCSVGAAVVRNLTLDIAAAGAILSVKHYSEVMVQDSNQGTLGSLTLKAKSGKGPFFILSAQGQKTVTL